MNKTLYYKDYAKMGRLNVQDLLKTTRFLLTHHFSFQIVFVFYCAITEFQIDTDVPLRR